MNLDLRALFWGNKYSLLWFYFWISGFFALDGYPFWEYIPLGVGIVTLLFVVYEVATAFMLMDFTDLMEALEKGDPE